LFPGHLISSLGNILWPAHPWTW